MIRRNTPARNFASIEHTAVARAQALPSSSLDAFACAGWAAFLLLVSLLLIEPIVPGVT